MLEPFSRLRTTPATLLLPGLASTEWQRAIDRLAPSGITSRRRLKKYLLSLASDAIRTAGQGRVASARMARAVQLVLNADAAVMGQGIVVAGARAVEASVTNNSIGPTIQGVHVGLGGPASLSASAAAVAIESNSIRLLLPASARRERHGIFVGNADSVVIERNQVHLGYPPGIDPSETNGIRVFGRMGASVIVEHNHLHDGLTPGVTWAPLNQPLPARPLWIVTENVMERAAVKVDIPQGSPGHPGVANVAAVIARTHGLADNFA